MISSSCVSEPVLCLYQDRPAIQLYQPGARSRNRAAGGGGAESNSADRKPDTEARKVAEKEDD